jgi:protein MpaA
MASRRAPLVAQSPLTAHRAHDYRALIRRWRAVARASGLEMRRYASADGYPLYALRSPRLPSIGVVYLSAGIHGDEPAGSEALTLWAEHNAARLREMPCVLFPCLNPWGLVNNRRVDAAGQDLNRCFHRDDLPSVSAWKALISGLRFKLAMTLHEDFDGQGLYLYEVDPKPFWGEQLLEAARSIIPIEGRTRVDGRKAAAGLLRPRITLKKFATMGLPEAVYLYLHHSDRTFTVETPSEFALDQRVAAHVAVIDEAVRRVCA